jgi:3-oxoacyl-[acyl-carrier protein] reductase
MSEAVKTAIVTGGSRGIGRAIAIRLAQAGHAVLLNYVERSTSAIGVVREIEALGGVARALAADVTDPAACAALAECAQDTWGRIDVLVNNAGVGTSGASIVDTPRTDWQRIVDINLFGTWHMVQAVVPHMRAQRSGNVVNLSSNVTARLPAKFGAYTISKAAVEVLTAILAKEEGAYGIRVNAIAPGPIMTEMLQGALAVMGPDKARAFVASVPLGRVGQPEEIAAMVAMLVSDDASFCTGQTLYVNGGGPQG